MWRTVYTCFFAAANWIPCIVAPHLLSDLAVLTLNPRDPLTGHAAAASEWGRTTQTVWVHQQIQCFLKAFGTSWIILAPTQPTHWRNDIELYSIKSVRMYMNVLSLPPALIAALVGQLRCGFLVLAESLDSALWDDSAEKSKLFSFRRRERIDSHEQFASAA